MVTGGPYLLARQASRIVCSKRGRCTVFCSSSPAEGKLRTLGPALPDKLSRPDGAHLRDSCQEGTNPESSRQC